MTDKKKAELISKHAAARRRLRAEGREESLGNVLGIAGGSKRDIVALWTESDPDTAPLPMSEAEANFRQTFADYLAAATRFNAISLRPFDLPQRHPWYEKLKEELATAYNNHIAAWHVIEGYEEAQRPAPVPAPEPPPPPAFDRANLRAYYLNRFESPWPAGMVPPLEAREVLLALRQEWKDEMGKADRDKYVVLNRLSQERVRDIDDHPEMRAVETRRGLARLQVHSMTGDLDILRRRAHDLGIELPDPLTH